MRTICNRYGKDTILKGMNLGEGEKEILDRKITSIQEDKSKKEDKFHEKDFNYLKNAASATDMTGLIYRAAEDDAEAEAYEEIYQYLPPTEK